MEDKVKFEEDFKKCNISAKNSEPFKQLSSGLSLNDQKSITNRDTSKVPNFRKLAFNESVNVPIFYDPNTIIEVTESKNVRKPKTHSLYEACAKKDEAKKYTE